MKIAYIGNFGPPHSTENHVASAAERLGHTVLRWQENTPYAWTNPKQLLTDETPELILWTRTGWDWPHDCGWDHAEAMDRQDALLEAAGEARVPTVGFHLDRWWGLDREGQVHDEAFFRCDLVCTADGGHDQEFADAGVNHHWLPPAVSLAETERVGRRQPRAYPGQVGFVGSWRPGYHAEWDPHRQAMLAACRRAFGRQFNCWPRGRALRGQPLADLYATVPILVGDSCLAPIDNPPIGYWSDRIPETIGRGAILVHPDPEGVEGLDSEQGTVLRRQFEPCPSLTLYPLGDYDALIDQVRWLLELPPATLAAWRAEGRAFVQQHHTYERRVEQIIDLAGDLEP